GLEKISLDKSITGSNMAELFKPVKGKGYMGYTDYLGRKMIMTKKVFDKHTTGKYLGKNELRHQLFPHIKDILKDPDEVWLNEYDSGEHTLQSRYVKFYKNKIMIVDCGMRKGIGTEIKTWYQNKTGE